MLEDQPHKTMQDHTPETIACSKCGAIIVPAVKIHAYRERQISNMIASHQCRKADEAKRDFQQEVL